MVYILNDLIIQLGGILKEEADIYDDILKVSKQKTSIIVEGKVNELEKIVKMEQSFIFKIAGLESKREALIGKLSGLMGQKPEELTISSIADHSDEKESIMLKNVQQSMVGLIKELCNSNELNSRLIKNSLDYINFSIGLFANIGNEDNNYSPNAEKFSKKGRNLLDLKI